MEPQKIYHRAVEGLRAVKRDVLSTIDNYVERGVVAMHEHTPASAPVHTVIRVPAASYVERIPSLAVYTPTIREYSKGRGSLVARMGAERCNVNRNALDKGAKRVRHTSWRARRKKARKSL